MSPLIDLLRCTKHIYFGGPTLSFRKLKKILTSLLYGHSHLLKYGIMSLLLKTAAIGRSVLNKTRLYNIALIIYTFLQEFLNNYIEEKDY